MKSNNDSFRFTFFSEDQLNKFTSVRAGETKLGEKVNIPDAAGTVSGKYLVLGISEDIGPQANGGNGGAGNAFAAFLKRFLNVQSNRFLSGESVCILGEIKACVAFENIEKSKELVSELDDLVTDLLKPYLEAGMIPVVIGGGHNNAYPLIRAVSQVSGAPIGVINCDPHADFRPLEGRHSGNPFSYAYEGGFMDSYAIIGLHQSYNSAFILDQLSEKGMLVSFYDDYLSGKDDFQTDLRKFATHMQEQRFGVELDLDAIAWMPSSAFSPSGITLEQARAYVVKMADSAHVKYLHLPEGAPQNPVEEAIVGKALAYLVTDFIKVHSAHL